MRVFLALLWESSESHTSRSGLLWANLTYFIYSVESATHTWWLSRFLRCVAIRFYFFFFDSFILFYVPFPKSSSSSAVQNNRLFVPCLHMCSLYVCEFFFYVCKNFSLQKETKKFALIICLFIYKFPFHCASFFCWFVRVVGRTLYGADVTVPSS